MEYIRYAGPEGDAETSRLGDGFQLQHRSAARPAVSTPAPVDVFAPVHVRPGRRLAHGDVTILGGSDEHLTAEQLRRHRLERGPIPTEPLAAQPRRLLGAFLRFEQPDHRHRAV